MITFQNRHTERRRGIPSSNSFGHDGKKIIDQSVYKSKVLYACLRNRIFSYRERVIQLDFLRYSDRGIQVHEVHGDSVIREQLA